MKRTQSWGRLDNTPHNVIPLTAPDVVAALVRQQAPGLARGNGRSYGDVALNPEGTLWDARGLDRFVHWDASSGTLRCEAGVLLKDIQRTFVPQGWTLPVTPGTQLVTVGGAIANDVHGKNHHAEASFGNHVREFTLVRTTGEILRCSPEQNPEYFFATIGGLGLTGIITAVELQLKPIPGPWLEVETPPFQGLHEFFKLSDQSEDHWEHSVAWLDCLSGGERPRGVFTRARPINVSKRPARERRTRGMPFVPPFSLVNGFSLRPFNWAYYLAHRWKPARSIEHYEQHLYPLDKLENWNRMYGPRGFYQYQSVVPIEHGSDATTEMLNEIKSSGSGSFLAVLKTFGNTPSVGMLSFPRAGVTLALDFPNRGDETLRLFERLDSIVLEAGGALYPAKDARMSCTMFERGFPRFDEFLPLRDPGMTSGFSRRVLGF